MIVTTTIFDGLTNSEAIEAAVGDSFASVEEAWPIARTLANKVQRQVFICNEWGDFYTIRLLEDLRGFVHGGIVTDIRPEER